MTDKKPEQYSVEAEQQLIGALLYDDARLPMAMADVSADDFWDPLHRRIFDAMVEMLQEGDGQAITTLSLYTAMRDDPGVESTGGKAYFDAMRDAAPALPNMRQLAGIVRDLAMRRGAILACRDAIEIMEITSQPVTKALRDVVVAADTASALSGRSRPQAASVVAQEVMERARRVYAGEHIPMVTTGLKALDDAMGGMQGGDLIILPGRSGMGKSALAGGISLRASMGGNPVLDFSLEMKASQWIERNITDLDFDTAVHPIPYQAFRKGNLSGPELDRCDDAKARLPAPDMMEICADRGLTIHDIGARARAFKAKHPGKLGLIVIDYLQIVQPAGGRDRSREQEVSQIAVGLKTLAKSLNWPVVACAQLLTKGGDPRMANKEQIPTLAAIRESGGIEMEADIIIAPHRKSFYLRKSRPDLPQEDPEYQIWLAEYRACKNIMKIFGLKNRHGAEFECDMYCNMMASAIRDEEPRVPMSVEDRAARDLLDGLG